MSNNRLIPTLLIEGHQNHPRRSNRIATIKRKRVIGSHLDENQNQLDLSNRISQFPNEILSNIFSILRDSLNYLPIPYLPTTLLTPLLTCAQVCQRWARLALPIMYRKYYISKIIPQVAIPKLAVACQDNLIEWARICMVALVCLHMREWNVGAPKLFYINCDQRDGRKIAAILDSAMMKHPNPSSVEWRKIIFCSMDLLDCFWELATGKSREECTADIITFSKKQVDSLSSPQSPAYLPLENLPLDLVSTPNVFTETEYNYVSLSEGTNLIPLNSQGNLLPGQRNIPMMLRYSERMDIGCFLFFMQLSFGGSVLLRAKPVGTQTAEFPLASGSLIIWDDHMYGVCNKCGERLQRVQVCAECRIAQYCSRNCQRLDWETQHRSICKSLSFYPYGFRENQ